MSEDASPAIPAAKVEACVRAARAPLDPKPCPSDFATSDAWALACDRAMVAAILRAAAAYDAQQRAAAGPQPARERDTDAWWAD